MPKLRGPRKQYTVPNKSRSLFQINIGAASGGSGACAPCNAAGQRVSTAGLGQGPLEGGPRDNDGFLMKAEDDDLKIVIYQQMSLGEREFAIAFMAQDKPAPLPMLEIERFEIPVDIKKMDGYRKPPIEFHAVSRGIGIPPHWITNDFVYHYFFRDGQMVDLRWVNLGNNFEKAASIMKLVDGFIKETFPKVEAGFSKSDFKFPNLTFEKSLFVLGDSPFVREIECDDERCLYHFALRDKFKDPLDIGFEVGGTPYEINYDFYRAFKLPEASKL